MIYTTTCRVSDCGRVLYAGEECEHLRLDEAGRCFLVHPVHQFEPDPYATVTRVAARPPEPPDDIVVIELPAPAVEAGETLPPRKGKAV